MVKRFVILLICSFYFLFSTSCGYVKSVVARNFKQGELATGIARLSARDLSILGKVAASKFQNKNLDYKVIKSDDPLEYGKGTVIQKINDIEISFPNGKTVYSNCIGENAIAKGNFKIKEATKEIYGRLTSNPDNPVIPDKGKVKLKFHLELNNIKVIFDSAKDKYIVYKEGEATFDFYPRLAQDQSVGATKGLLIVKNPNSLIKNITMKNVKGKLVSPAVVTPIEIDDSNFTVQVGEGEGDKENYMKGVLTAFGNKHEVPIDNKGFNPDYNRSEFRKTYKCSPKLNGKISFQHISPEEKFAPNLSALTVVTMAQIISKLEKDHKCGFASESFLRNTDMNFSETGIGSAVSKLKDECTLSFNNYETKPNCYGNAFRINGEVSIKEAKKIISGLILFRQSKSWQTNVDVYVNKLNKSENKSDLKKALEHKPVPAIPFSPKAVHIEIAADLSKLELEQICRSKKITTDENHCLNKPKMNIQFGFKKGQIKASMHPMLAKRINENDKRYGLCSYPIPVAHSKIDMNGVKTYIKSNDIKLKFLTQGNFEAIIGKIGKKENDLNGKVQVGTYDVALDHRALNPNYHRETYINSYLSCHQGEFEVVEHDDECIPHWYEGS